MTTSHNSRLSIPVPVVEDNGDHHPHDEPPSMGDFSANAFLLGEERSHASSRGTYYAKDPLQNIGSLASKRSARNAPSIEPERKQSNLQSLSSIPIPTLADGAGYPFDRDVVQEQGVARTNGFLSGLRGPGLFSDSVSLNGIDSLRNFQGDLPPIPSKHLPRLQQPPISRPTAATSPMLQRPIDTTVVNSNFADAERSAGLGLGQPNQSTQNTRDGVLHWQAPIFNGLPGVIETLEGTTISSFTDPDHNRRTPAFASNLSVGDAASVASRRTFQESSFRPGNPRSILNERYQKRYKRSFTKKDFCSIKDTRDGDHIPTFTSVFVCPETGELFLSGDLLSADLVLQRDGMNWYKTKNDAEFAAAGRAEDYFRFRSGEIISTSNAGNFFCSEPPVATRGDDGEDDTKELSEFLQSEAVQKLVRKHLVDQR